MQLVKVVMGIFNRCPKCNSFSKIPILYGYPSREGLQRAKNGKIALGGCIVRPSNPKWQCKKCGYRWGGKKEVTSINRNTSQSISKPVLPNSIHKGTNKKGDKRDKWKLIGEWRDNSGFSVDSERNIPKWIRTNINKYCIQVLLNNKQGGTKHTHDKYYWYKLVFDELDEYIECDIYRKRRFVGQRAKLKQ